MILRGWLSVKYQVSIDLSVYLSIYPPIYDSTARSGFRGPRKRRHLFADILGGLDVFDPRDLEQPAVALCFQCLIPLLQICCQRPTLAFVEQYGEHETSEKLQFGADRSWCPQLLLHILLRPAIADMATASSIFTSADDLPSFVMVEPRRLTASTSWSFCPFMVKFALMLLALLTITLLFSDSAHFRAGYALASAEAKPHFHISVSSFRLLQINRETKLGCLETRHVPWTGDC